MRPGGPKTTIRHKAAIGAVVGLGIVGMGGTAFAAILPPNNPVASIPETYPGSCSSAPTGSACMTAMVSQIDTARALEGVKPLTLPSNWLSLSEPQQIFVITDLERVDRGLAPAIGLSPALNSLAQAGAVAGGDPTGPSGYGWGSNWSGGYTNALASDFGFMYDDGLGSYNIDCSVLDTAGCWGHRDNILNTTLSHIGMGTAVAGVSQTELLVGNWAGPYSFTWAQELPYFGAGAVSSTGANPGGTVAVADYTVGSSQGYWTVTGTGAVTAHGAAPSYGSAPGGLSAPIVGITATPDMHGYWLVASDGGVFSFGDARFFGSAGGIRLAKPIVGMTSTPDGGGYWLVASDGGVFSYGDAHFYGSTGNIRLNKPVVGMAATPDGGGYWLVASDGGIFAYGDAHFYGSTGNIRLAQPVVGMSVGAGGTGYRLVASDGGIFSFGSAAFYGSLGGKAIPAPVTGMSSTPNGDGYMVSLLDGQVQLFGNA